MPLESEDRQRLTVAEGYAELGMYLDAQEELGKIEPDVRHVPEVLAIRLLICNGLKMWELMQTVAARLNGHDPGEVQWWVSLAFATRRVESIEAAKAVLLRAIALHSDEAILHYNLACYECQLANLNVAKERLRVAFKLDPRFRLAARDDDDLAPLWDSLGGEEAA
jgi:tetratricopeptide (TPR) repeat protein